ncbi:MAG: hypothetical protein NVS3B5_04870 [Sphingomicrobium sp.]
MFGLPTLQLSVKARTGLGQWAGAAIATFGLVLTILGTIRNRPAWVPASVALYITSAYGFTSSVEALVKTAAALGETAGLRVMAEAVRWGRRARASTASVRASSARRLPTTS